MTRLVLVGLLLAACGGDNSPMQQIDAPGSGSGSGSMNKVMAVTCPTTADATVTTTATVDAYMPMTQTVPVNAVVKFTMASTHNVAPNTQTTTDPGLSVGFGETKCLKFTQAGTYGFFCSAHSFSGTITVQ